MELVGDLEGQGQAEGQVGEGEIDHEDDGGSLGRGAEQEQPHGKSVSNQVYDGDDRVDGRNDDAGVCVLEQGQGGVVQLTGVARHDRIGMASNHLGSGLAKACEEESIQSKQHQSDNATPTAANVSLSLLVPRV